MQVSKHIPSQIFIALSLMLALSGCALTDMVTGEPEEIEQNELETKERVAVTAEPGLKPKQRFTNALRYLEFGETDKALAELKAYDAVVPNNKTVDKLIRQITTPSSEYFPSDFYTLELKSGESLSTLSKKYLGSALDFFALAKYNNIKSARRVLIGQKIKIPHTQLAKSVWQKELLAASINADELSDAIEDVDAVDINEESELAAESLVDNADMAVEETGIDENEIDTAAFEDQLLATQQAIEVTPEHLALEIEQLNMSGDHEQAMTKYEELVLLDESNPSLEPMLMQTLQGRAGQLTDSDPSQAAEYYQKVADMYLDNEDDVGHYVNLAMASEADSSNTQLALETAKLKKELVDKYHRQASSEFRRQDLEPAIANWDKVLRIDPAHNNAKVFRARAIDLKERLSKIKD